MAGWLHTLVPQVHLQFQGFELVGDARLRLTAHLLAGPLLEAVELLVDVHDCDCGCVEAEDRLRGVAVIRAAELRSGVDGLIDTESCTGKRRGKKIAVETARVQQQV